ncbi:hypothetical protein ABIF66_000109 [Bradyrhizobium japonicum]
MVKFLYGVNPRATRRPTPIYGDERRGVGVYREIARGKQAMAEAPSALRRPPRSKPGRSAAD